MHVTVRSLNQGDTLQFTLDRGLWSISFCARQQAPLNSTETVFRYGPVEVLGPKSATDPHLISTAGWVQGKWNWRLSGTLNGVTSTAGSGEITIWPAPPTTPGTTPFDARTQTERDWEALRETLRRWNERDWVQQQSIQGRAMSRYSLAELIELEKIYAARVRNERIARGLPVAARYLVMKP